MGQLKRVAILLGVARYNGTALSDLPACANDVAAMRALLDKQFDTIEQIDTEQDAPTVREQLTAFFRELQSQQIGDLLVFLTGHGATFDEDFHFLLSDYDDAHRSVTSISNTEIDDLARGVSPGIYCKIVDACHSGVSYVKDAGAIERWVRKGQSGFNACYFYFSSQPDQQSYTPKEGLSFFTSAIVQAVAKYSASTITYHALAASVGDMFRENAGQTPLFVHQGKSTELFLELGNELQQGLISKINGSDKTPIPMKVAGVSSTQSLADRIKQESPRFISEEQALPFLEELKLALQSAEVEADLRELFTFEVTATFHFSGAQQAAKWLEDHKNEKYFVYITHSVNWFDALGRSLSEEEAKKRRKSQSSLFFSAFDAVRSTRTPDGFSQTESGPWTSLVLHTSSELAELPLWALELTYALGPTNIAVFSVIQRHERTGWKDHGQLHSVTFTADTANMEEITKGIAQRIIATRVGSLQDSIRRDLTRRYPEPSSE